MKRSVLSLGLILLISTLLTAQNNSVFFNGSSRARVRDGLPFNPLANESAYKISGSAITLEAWVYPLYGDTTAWWSTDISIIAGRSMGNTEHAYALLIDHAGPFPQASFQISDGIGGGVTVRSPDPLEEFTWSHIAGSYDGSYLRLYVNGELKEEVAVNLSISSDGYGFYIGRFISNSYCGLIDDVRLWNITRTDSAIAAFRNTQLTGSEVGLAGYWKMDNTYVLDDTYTIMPDETSNANDLRMVGGELVPMDPLEIPSVITITTPVPTFDLGNLEQGEIAYLDAEIVNTGGYGTLGYFVSTSPEFIFRRTRLFYIPAGESRTISMSVQPLVPGFITATLSSVTDASNEVSLDVTLYSIAIGEFSANNIHMWFLRNGRFAYDPIGHGTGVSMYAGLEWPKGTLKKAVYSSGFWLGGTVGGETRISAAEYQSEFQAGPIVGGVPADPYDLQYRVYSIRTGDNAANSTDYAEWPAHLGAPVNSDGSPKLIGDQTLFAVYNDLTAPPRRFYSDPLGAEIQQTVFGFDRFGHLGNTVFLRFKIINKSADNWENTYLALWSDPDLGDPYDDLVGIDTNRTLGYTYNGVTPDAVYGFSSPAVGYDILKGAFFTKPIQAFAYYTSGQSYPDRDPSNYEQAYYFLQGLRADGSPYIDPTTLQATRFPLSGDPLMSAGWIDSNPSDKRFLFSTGPLTLEPGQSKEFIAAIVLAQGTNRLNSVAALKEASDTVQANFDEGFIFGGAVENVSTFILAADDSTWLDDVSNSGTELLVEAGPAGVTVNVASYVEPPAGAVDISSPSVAGVGKYMELETVGDIVWPVYIRIFYTANDLAQEGVTEADLQGIYYWSGISDEWRLYSESGPDDQGRGPSTTGVSTTNVTLDGIEYEGYVYAFAYHLTTIVVGAKKANINGLYANANGFLESLASDAFRKPADNRKQGLIKDLRLSREHSQAGRSQAALAVLQGVMNRVEGSSKDNKNSWIVDGEARDQLLSMLNSLLNALRTSAEGDEMSREMELVPQKGIPDELALGQNYPNPFNPSTEIAFTIPSPGMARVSVYNMLGEEIAVLFDRDVMAGGSFRVRFNGASFPSGMYFARLEHQSGIIIRKMLLVK